MHTLVVVSDAIKKLFFSSVETTYEENANRDADRYLSVYSDGSADLETVPGSWESLLSPQTQKAHEVLYHGVTNQSSKENFISTDLFNLKSRTSGKCTTFFFPGDGRVRTRGYPLRILAKPRNLMSSPESQINLDTGLLF